MSGTSPTAASAQGSTGLSYEETKQLSQQKEALRVSQLYGSGAGAAKNLTMAGKKKQGNVFVSEGIIHFPFDPEVDMENAKIKVFNCREIHKGEGRAAFGGGVRLLEQAVTSASASFNEILNALSVTLKLKLEPTELAALLAEFRCVETFKRKGRIHSRVMVKPFVTGLIRLAETIREQYRQKHRKECDDFHERHVQALKVIDDYYTIDRPSIRIPLTLSRSLALLTDKVASSLHTGTAAPSSSSAAVKGGGTRGTPSEFYPDYHSYDVSQRGITDDKGITTHSSYEQHSSLQLALMLSRQGLELSSSYNYHHSQSAHQYHGLPLPNIPGLDGLERLREAAQWTWEHDRPSFARFMRPGNTQDGALDVPRLREFCKRELCGCLLTPEQAAVVIAQLSALATLKASHSTPLPSLLPGTIKKEKCMVGKKFAKYVTPTRKQLPVYPSAAQGQGLGPGAVASGPGLGPGTALVGADGVIDFHATIPMDFFLQQIRLLAIDRLTPVDTLSTRPLPGGMLTPLEIGKNALDKANRAIEKAQRARRAQKGIRSVDGDGMEDEEYYRSYEGDGHDDVIMSHRGEGMTAHSTLNDSVNNHSMASGSAASGGSTHTFSSESKMMTGVSMPPAHRLASVTLPRSGSPPSRRPRRLSRLPAIEGEDDEKDEDNLETNFDPTHPTSTGMPRSLSADRQGLGLASNAEEIGLGAEDLARALLNAQQSPSASMYHKMGVGIGIGVGGGLGGDQDDSGQGLGPGKNASTTTRTRRQSAGGRSDISSGEMSLATSGQDSWAVSVNQDYGNDGSDASVGSNDDNRSRLSLTSGFQTLEQRQKQENRKRRKQQHDKKKQQQKYRDVSGMMPSQEKYEKKHKLESYVDKVKNLFVGVQPVENDGGLLTLTEKGRAYRFVHRWPLLMQLVQSLRLQRGHITVSSLLTHLRDTASFLALGAVSAAPSRSLSRHGSRPTSATVAQKQQGGKNPLTFSLKQGLVAYIPTLREAGPLIAGGEKTEGVVATGRSDVSDGMERILAGGEKGVGNGVAGGSGGGGGTGGGEIVAVSTKEVYKEKELYKEKDREKDKANQAAVTPAYPPFASALVPHARWVSVEVVIRTLNNIMGGNIHEGETNQQPQQQQSRREREQQGLALTEEEITVIVSSLDVLDRKSIALFDLAVQLHFASKVLCSPNAPPSTAQELVMELLHNGMKEYILTLPHNRLFVAGRERGDWRGQPVPLSMVFTVLCTVCTSQEKEIALLTLLLPLVHIVYQDSPHLHEQTAFAQGLGLGSGEGGGVEGVFNGPGRDPRQGQMPDYWTPSSKFPWVGESSNSTVTSVYSDTPHMVIKTPAKYPTDIAKGKAEQFIQIRAMLQEDKIRDQTLAEQQQQQQAKMKGSRAGGVGSSNGQFSLKQPSALTSTSSGNNPQQSAKTPYTPSGSYSGGGGDTPTSSLDRRERQIHRMKEMEASMKAWIDGLPPGITFDTINTLEVTTINLLAYLTNTPALSSFLEDLLIDILYALATIQDEIPMEETSSSELL